LPPGVEVELTDDSPRLKELVSSYAAQRSVKEGVARRLVGRPMSYAAMMVACGYADGMVAGITCPTATVIQTAALTVGLREGVKTASSFFIMVLPQFRGERDVPLIFADCAVIIDPTAEQLAGVAVASAESARRFLGVTPRVAMLSFSTAGSASHPAVDKVKEATRLAAERIKDGYVDGELQLDAAINPEVAAKKGVGNSEVAGKANVLIFPDLNAGNICYKALAQFAGARAIGPVLQGFARPVNDLSRSAKVEDVVGTTIITVLQSAKSA
jgi:phosphate acetyltransferase